MRYGLVLLTIVTLVVTTLWRFGPEPSPLHHEAIAQRSAREAEEIEIVEGAAKVAGPVRMEDRPDIQTFVGAPISVVRVLQRSARQTPAYSSGNP